MVMDVASKLAAIPQSAVANEQVNSEVADVKAVVAEVQQNVPAAEAPSLSIDDAVSMLQDFAKSMQRNLNFSVDSSTGRSVVTVLESDTEKVIRQIPNEVALSIAHNIERIKGVLFEEQA